MAKQFIGKKEVATTRETGEKTLLGGEIIEVRYKDDTIEHLSRIMFDKVISDKQCDDTELREKRIVPIVQVVLGIMREWGIKTGELPYFSALLNNSLDKNTNQALLELVSDWMPKPLSLDDVDLITVDRILTSKSKDGKDAK